MSKPDKVDSVDERMVKMAKLFASRDKEYGSNFTRMGPVLHAMFPRGCAAHNPAEWQMIFTMVMLTMKLTRYASAVARGDLGHADSLDDMAVYALMGRFTDDTEIQHRRDKTAKNSSSGEFNHTTAELSVQVGGVFFDEDSSQTKSNSATAPMTPEFVSSLLVKYPHMDDMVLHGLPKMPAHRPDQMSPRILATGTPVRDLFTSRYGHVTERSTDYVTGKIIHHVLFAATNGYVDPHRIYVKFDRLITSDHPEWGPQLNENAATGTIRTTFGLLPYNAQVIDTITGRKGTVRRHTTDYATGDIFYVVQMAVDMKHPLGDVIYAAPCRLSPIDVKIPNGTFSRIPSAGSAIGSSPTDAGQKTS